MGVDLATWHILTTSFPPYRGGLGFHSFHLGECLASRGHNVYVWSAFDPRTKDKLRRYQLRRTVEHHRISDVWNEESFSVVADQINELGGYLLVQYRPLAFLGSSSAELVSFLKRLRNSSLKVGLMIHRTLEDAAVLHGTIRPHEPFTMWHSVWWHIKQLRLTCQILPSADFVFVTSSRVGARLRYLPYWGSPKLQNMPVSSPVAHQARGQQVANLRAAFLGDRRFIVGTYSSFKEPEVLDVLSKVMVSLLREHRSWLWLGFGRYSNPYFRFLAGAHPDISERMLSAGELDHEALSAHIGLCDVMFQPYYQGINTQRASAMVVLDHAKPLVTSLGKYTEKIWQSSGAVKLCRWNHCQQYKEAIEQMAESGGGELGQRGKSLYEQSFSWQKTLRVLEDAVAEPELESERPS